MAFPILAAAGVAGGLLGGLLKKKPKVPEFKPVNAGEETANAIGINRSNFSSATQLGEDVNQFNQEQLLAAMRGAIPDVDAISGTASKNLLSMLRGELPDDVASNVERRAAARGYSGGVGGSQFAKNMTARDLGLTSLQITQQGLDSATRWISNARQNLVAPQFDVTSMFISPSQNLQNTWMNRQAEFNRNFMGNQIDAQYDWRTQLGNTMQQAGGFAQNWDLIRALSGR